MRVRFVTLFLASLFVGPGTARAQNYSFDAREIALGGVGGTANVATKMIDEQRTYGSIVLPFGLIQVLSDINRLNPGDDAFDPVATMEYAASPLHYIIGRNSNDAGGRFVTDLVNGELNRNLNTYRGFVPANELTAEGLAAPNWGKTFRIRESGDGSFQGIYVGAGPYMAVRTSLNVDPRLTSLLASETDTFLPNTTFLMSNSSAGQIALAVTGGYRARMPWPGGGGGASARDGLYLAANYHYLHGFQYNTANFNLRFDTDSQGLVAVNPVTTPIVIEYLSAQSGKGFALDFGMGAVVDRWDFGFGVSGVANRIDWKDFERKRFTLQSLVLGGEFVEQILPSPISTERVELPVTKAGNVAYHADNWSAIGEVSHGFQGMSVHTGFEQRFDRIELRGGARYSRDRWHPSGGVGFDFSDRVSLDVAAFSTSTNIQRERKTAVAASIRLNRMP